MMEEANTTDAQQRNAKLQYIHCPLEATDQDSGEEEPPLALDADTHPAGVRNQQQLVYCTGRMQAQSYWVD